MSCFWRFSSLAGLSVLLVFLFAPLESVRSQTPGQDVVDETAPEFRALCRAYTSPIKEEFSQAVTGVFKTAYERGLVPSGQPFALFSEPLKDETQIGTSTKWSACVVIASGELTKTGDEYALDTYKSLRSIRTTCSTENNGSDVCHKRLVEYTAANALGLLTTYLVDNSVLNSLTLSVFVKAL